MDALYDTLRSTWAFLLILVFVSMLGFIFFAGS